VEYCNLGKSGLEVSRLGLGGVFFGTGMDEVESQRTFDAFFDAGGTFIDTANVYGGGMRATNEKAGTSERTIGKITKGKRDRLVIGTKGYWLMEREPTPNSVGLSRTYLAKNIEGSLRRLNTDYIDLYQCHVWDFYTPIEETMRVLDDHVRAGKIRYVGVSNWDGWHVVKANAYVKSANLTPIVSNQIYYNIVDRVPENSLIPACRDQSVSIISWGAMAQGFLSGEYKRGARGPVKGSRLSGDQMKEGESTSWEYLATEKNWTILEHLRHLAAEHASIIPNVARRWLLQSGFCDVVLIGGESFQQYENALGITKFRLSEEEVEQLGGISKPQPVYPTNLYRHFCHRESKFWGGLR
jgi:aryl-alcohol dehydrogenase-like predicted oxidoreductase